MNRREFTAVLGGAAAWPLAARAQPTAKVWRIGCLSGLRSRTHDSELSAGMQERGYVEGKNLNIEYRWSAGKSEPLEQFAVELVRAGVDVIVTVGTPATLAAKLATSTIPIVFAAAGAPIEKGLVSSLGRPGGNVTGLALITDDIKSLEILKEIVPGITRAAFIYDPQHPPRALRRDLAKWGSGPLRRLKVDLRPVTRAIPMTPVRCRGASATADALIGNPQTFSCAAGYALWRHSDGCRRPPTSVLSPMPAV